MAFDNSSTDAGNNVTMVVMGFVGRVNVDDARAFSAVMATTDAEDDDEAADCCEVVAVITPVLLDIFAADFPRMS